MAGAICPNIVSRVAKGRAGGQKLIIPMKKLGESRGPLFSKYGTDPGFQLNVS